MKTLITTIFLFLTSVVMGQKSEIDLSPWSLELPTGYKASDWKLMNFENDVFAQPFLYVDSTDGALVMEAYPSPGTSKAKYTKNSLKEKVIPCENKNNWSLAEGGKLTAEFQVESISKKDEKKYHRTLLFQVHGKTSKEQNKELGLSKSVSVPLLSVFWQNERIRVVRKVLKDDGTVADNLFKKDSWENDAGRFFNKKVSFHKNKIEITATDGRIEITINDERPIVYRDTSVRKWPFKNYFNVGNYLQTKDIGSKSKVKFYTLEVSH